MVITVTGGSSSGKSAMAEGLAMQLEGGSKLYIATMLRATADEDPIIARHRKLREGKNFTTLECPLNPELSDITPGTTVLLECVANLLTNELFGIDGNMSDGLNMIGTMKDDDLTDETASNTVSGGGIFNEEDVSHRSIKASQRVIASIKKLKEKCGNLILVTNEVFSDGIEYDGSVMEYIRELGTVNRALMELSDVYVESVYGLPCLYKPASEEDIPETINISALGKTGGRKNDL